MLIVMRTLAVTLTMLAGVAHAAPRDVAVYESRDRAVTEGDATLATDPDTSYVAATDFSRWAQIFPDVREAIVTERAGNDAHVTVVHSDGHRDRLHFRNRPAARTIWFEQIGGRADVWAEIAFNADDQPNTTRVHSRLYADVHGLAAALVSASDVRAAREQQVRDDLRQLQAYFNSAPR